MIEVHSRSTGGPWQTVWSGTDRDEAVVHLVRARDAGKNVRLMDGDQRDFDWIDDYPEYAVHPHACSATAQRKADSAAAYRKGFNAALDRAEKNARRRGVGSPHTGDVHWPAVLGWLRTLRP